MARHIAQLIALAFFLGSMSANDLDDFMSKVVKTRKINAENLSDYIFNEKETLEIKGINEAAMESFRREYVWFVRDGYFVRSPTRINGVKVPAKEQKDAEEAWIKREKKGRRGGSLDREAFFNFKFENGRSFYAGEQQFEGQKVAVIEYYPVIQNDEKAKKKRNAKEENYLKLFEKTFLVTMLVDPEEHQIVKLTFDNVGLEFLPFRWLIRLNDIKASMIMHKPLKDAWLPKEIAAYGSMSTAAFTVTIDYKREFSGYAKSDVKAKIWFDEEKEEPKQ